MKLAIRILVIFALMWSCPFAAGGDATPQAAKYTQEIAGTKVKFEMVPVPAGEFLMGSPASEKERKDDEGPRVKIAIDAFWMGACEVTWEEFNEFAQTYQLAKKLAATTQIPKDKDADAVSLPTPLYQEKLGAVLEWGVNGKLPAVCMTQFSAKQYTKWLSKRTGRFHRLPTEAEWEYACRAGGVKEYSFGDWSLLRAHAWCLCNSEGRYHEVGRKKPNAWGLYDMQGNVAEWVIDGYDTGHYKRLEGLIKGGRVAWADAINWPTALDPRVVRGGHFDSHPTDLRCAARWFSDKAWKAKDPQLPKSIWWQTDIPYVGFRVVRPEKEPSEEEKRKYWDPDLDSIREVLKGDLQAKMLVEEATPRK